MSTALIIVSNGEARGVQRNTALLALAAALQNQPLLKENTITFVNCGVLSGAPSVADALQQATEKNIDHILIYPLFMSEGYFSNTVLPKQIAESGISVPITTLPLLGSDPALPDLLYRKAVTTLPKSWPIEKTRLLIVGHGSTKNPASAQATHNQAQSLINASQFLKIETAFLEETPFINDLLHRSKDLPTIIIGYFTGQGLHGKNDIEQAIQSTSATAIYAGSIGAMPEIKSLIQTAISDYMKSHKAGLL